jgi:outer membrane protein
MKKRILLFLLISINTFISIAQTTTDSVSRFPKQVYGRQKPSNTKVEPVKPQEKIVEKVLTKKEKKQLEEKLRKEKAAAEKIKKQKVEEIVEEETLPVQKIEERKDVKSYKIRKATPSDKQQDQSKNELKFSTPKKEQPEFKKLKEPIKIKKIEEIKNDEKRTIDKNTIKKTALEKQKKQKNYSSWTLEECIDYALKHNIQLSQQQLNNRLNDLMVKQNRMSQLPSINADASLGRSYGRSIDPTSNQFVNQGFTFNNGGLNAQMLLFGFFQKQLQNKQSKNLQQAGTYNYQQLENDIALNVATSYLKILLSEEQVNIAKAQLKTDEEQIKQTREFVRSGKLPELNLAQMEAQIATDNSNLVSAINNTTISILELKALLNMDFEEDIKIERPNMDAVQLFELYNSTEAEDVYNSALRTQPNLKSQYYQLLAEKNNISIAKSAMYPQLSLGGNVGTSYSSNFKEITNQNYIGETTVGFVNVAGQNFPVSAPNYTFDTRTIPYLNQLNNNTRSNIALSLNVPIFNGVSARTNIERAKVSLLQKELQFESEKLKLKSEVYRAWQEANTASQKYAASKKSETAAKRALDFSIQRYNIGLLNTFEYTSAQNNYNVSQINALSDKYDMIFKLKILDYYLGKPIKL